MTVAERTRGIAAVLRELAGEIDSLGAVLCSDPELAERYPSQLQAIDMIAQVQTALAELLGADCAACAAAEVRIGALRARLEHCLPHAGCAHAGH